MHETLRRRIIRRLETLPETQLYQVLDYIEFLESRYSRSPAEEVTGLQKLAERLEDGLRSRTLSPSRLREAFQLISAADRVLGSVAEAGREILSDLQIPSDLETAKQGDGARAEAAGREEGPPVPSNDAGTGERSRTGVASTDAASETEGPRARG